MELAYIDVPDEFTGVVIEKLGQRKGELRNMTPSNGGYTRLEFLIPARGLIGYRGEFMTDTKEMVSSTQALKDMHHTKEISSIVSRDP